MVGDYDQAIGTGQRALSIAVALGDFLLQVVTHFYLGRAYHTQGDYRRALDYYAKTVAALEGERLYERFDLAGLPSVFSRTYLVLCFAELGQFAEGIAYGEEGVQISEAADQPYSLALACSGLGDLYLHKGDADKAVLLLERGLELCRIWHVPILFPRMAATLGYTYALSGRLREALPLLEQAVAHMSQFRFQQAHSRWVGCLGEAYLLANRLDDATGVAVRALELSQSCKERGHQAYVLRLLGDIAVHREPPDTGGAERL